MICRSSSPKDVSMSKYKEAFFYAGTVLWGILIVTVVLYLFFPYQKALGIAFQNVLGGNRIVFAVDGLKLRTMGVDASSIVVGRGDGGTPLLELANVRITWNPFSVLKGTLSVDSEASMYEGRLHCTIHGIPIFRGDRAGMAITFRNVNLSTYPEGRLPWFKGMKGTAKGWIQKEVLLAQADGQRGSFGITITGGEISELTATNFPRLVLPFKEIIAEGTMRGSQIEVTKISMNGNGMKINGTGTIDSGEQEHRVAIQLAYEALSENAPLPGRGTISISGSQSSPQITVARETAGTKLSRH